MRRTLELNGLRVCKPWRARERRITSTPLEPPLDWSTVGAAAESRAFVTFVNPSRHKGLLLFARLADMLGSRRPDIPILVVQSQRRIAERHSGN
jgi:hypothetical protein